MGNRILTLEEFHKEMREIVQKHMPEDLEGQRAFFYDMQTYFGKFPASKEQRDRYIKTGSAQ